MVLKLHGREYIVPELTFEHAEFLENASGVMLHDLVLGNNHTMTVARLFVQIVTGANAAEAREIVQNEIVENGVGALVGIVDAFVKAVVDSDFFARLLSLPTKAEREKLAQENASQPET